MPPCFFIFLFSPISSFQKPAPVPPSHIIYFLKKGHDVLTNNCNNIVLIRNQLNFLESFLVMMSDNKNSLTEEQQKQINEWVEALPTALHGLKEHIKVALVLKGFRSIDNFPSAEDRKDWEDLRVACGLKVADRIAVKKALYRPQPQGGKEQLNQSPLQSPL